MHEIAGPHELCCITENVPNNWIDKYPFPNIDDHKYSRGHTLILSGTLYNTGAARLMAGAALRIGSGLVTLASPRDAIHVNASHLTSIMLQEANSAEMVCEILTDKHFNCVGLGPGLPASEATCRMVEAVLKQNRITILDAGSLTCFSKNPERLFMAIKEKQTPTILTPHEGEFSRLFHNESCCPDKIRRAIGGATASGAVIILKGAGTVVATPKQHISVSNNAPPWLATAGTGDVLAGIVAGLVAQGMPVFEAASAAVWIHSEAGRILGPGMISSDLDGALRHIVTLLSKYKRP